MNRWVKDYFSFSRRDRIAILVLISLILLTLLLPYFFSNAIHSSRPGETDTAWIALVRALVVKQDSGHLVHFRQKWPERKPFTSQYADSGKFWKTRKFPDQKDRRYPEKRFVRESPSPVDINLADTTAFIALPGIGSRLAERLIHFREKLGGFYSINQVGEVYGLADSVFQKISPLLRLAPFALKKININTASVDELKAHPYIRYAIANSIIQYRNQHGAYMSIEDLKKIILITEDLYNKISPYLTTDN